MHQQFDGPVAGGVAGRDVHHHSNPIGSSTVHLNVYLGGLEAGIKASAPPLNAQGFPQSDAIIKTDDKLSAEQRRTLNDKVKLLESNFGQSGKVIWPTLHRIMGTANINEMPQQHYAAAETLLDNRLAIAGLESQLATQQQQANEHAGTLQNLQQEIQGLTQQNKKLRNKYQGLIEDHQESQSRQASEHASALRKLKEENLRLEAEVERQRKKAPRPCPDCHDKESRLVSTQHRLVAMAGAALCGFFTAGYFALLG